MIDALSFADCCAAYRVLRQNLRVDLGFDREKVTVVIATRTSLGLGVVAYTAHRYHKHLIVVTASGAVTPMITGLDPAPAIIGLETVENELRRHLGAMLPLVEESSRRSRVELSRIEAELARLRSRIEEGPAREGDPSAHVVLNRQRLRELIDSPELFAGATFREVRELYELAGE